MSEPSKEADDAAVDVAIAVVREFIPAIRIFCAGEKPDNDALVASVHRIIALALDKAREEEREACAKVADGEAHADCEVAEQIARFIRGRR